MLAQNIFSKWEGLAHRHGPDASSPGKGEMANYVTVTEIESYTNNKPTATLSSF